MQYTEGEIVREFNQARYKNKQIGILAQLNTCHRKDIIEILERNGVVIPDKYKHSHEEEYDYKAMVSKEKTPYKMQKKADKPKEEPKEPEKDPEEELEEYLKATLPTPESPITEEVKEIKSDKPYYFIWLGLTSLDRRITKLEHKYKRLKKMYKQLAKFILG